MPQVFISLLVIAKQELSSLCIEFEHDCCFLWVEKRARKMFYFIIFNEATEEWNDLRHQWKPKHSARRLICSKKFAIRCVCVCVCISNTVLPIGRWVHSINVKEKKRILQIGIFLRVNPLFDVLLKMTARIQWHKCIAYHARQSCACV